MPEYIEREKAFKLIKEHKEKETGAFSKGLNKGLHIAMSIIHSAEQLPAADVVEVVRCGECKSCEPLPNGNIWCKKHKVFMAMKPTDFCSSGVRKEDSNA